MTPEQCEHVLSLVLRRISYSEFVTRSGLAPRETPGFGIPLMREAIVSCDAFVIEYAMLLVHLFEEWSPEHAPTLIELLAVPWHRKHEDIASALQCIRDPRSINILYQTALTKLPYLDYNDSHALARKCTWALADIGTTEARARLEALASQTDETVAEYARKRLTRWNMELDRKGCRPPRGPGRRRPEGARYHKMPCVGGRTARVPPVVRRSGRGVPGGAARWTPRCTQ
jgi:hypothetical protein